MSDVRFKDYGFLITALLKLHKLSKNVVGIWFGSIILGLIRLNL